MSDNTYTKAKELHDRNHLQAYYARNSERRIGITEFIEDEYTLLEHYIPHGIGVAGIAVVGGLLIMRYNQSNWDYFNTAYFSSW